MANESILCYVLSIPIRSLQEFRIDFHVIFSGCGKVLVTENLIVIQIQFQTNTVVSARYCIPEQAWPAW